MITTLTEEPNNMGDNMFVNAHLKNDRYFEGKINTGSPSLLLTKDFFRKKD